MTEKYFSYLDESGDTGWKFDKPFQKGGSSRYLTIATLVTHETDRHRPRRVIKRLKEYYEKKHHRTIKAGEELKATDLFPEDRTKFLEFFIDEALKSKKFMRVISKTVKKENVTKSSFKDNPNSLYNYMTGYLMEKIQDCDLVLAVDARVVNVNLKYSFDDYLHAKWAGDLDRDGRLNIIHKNSKDSEEIQCIDIISNIIWRKHELEVHHEFEKIEKVISDLTLFF